MLTVPHLKPAVICFAHSIQSFLPGTMLRHLGLTTARMQGTKPRCGKLYTLDVPPTHTHTQEPHVTTQRLLEYIGLQFGLGKCVVNPNLRPATTSSNIQIIRTNRFSLTSTVAKRPKTSPAVFKDDMEM